MFNKRRDKLRQIKEETSGYRALVEMAQIIIEEEGRKDLTSEEKIKVQQLDIALSLHLSLIEENEAMIAKLERPFWKLFFRAYFISFNETPTPSKETQMFAKIRQFCYPKVTPVIKKSQQTLDQLRIAYANNQAMQLHLDRMQTAQEATTAA